MTSRKEGKSVFWEARIRASATNPLCRSRIAVADTIGVAESVIANFENGNPTGNTDAVLGMSDVYVAPELKTYYCKNVCPIGYTLPLATEQRPVEAIALSAVSAFDADTVSGMIKDLVRIAEDGRIDPEEVPVLAGIYEQIDKMLHSISELEILYEKTLTEK